MTSGRPAPHLLTFLATGRPRPPPTSLTNVRAPGPPGAPPDGGTNFSARRRPLSGSHAPSRRCLGLGYALSALDCVLGAAAAERLDGDPPWLLIVGGSGAAK